MHLGKQHFKAMNRKDVIHEMELKQQIVDNISFMKKGSGYRSAGSDAVQIKR